MTMYFDIRCGDDLDPFGRDADPLEVLAQDIYHLLITDPMSLVRDTNFGFGLESYLGKPLPPTLASDIESRIRRDDRVSNARCTITPIDGEADSYRMDLKVEADAGFLDMALQLNPSGIVRVS